ncbi:ATP-dependent helicase HrpB [Ornithinimicrobium pekingense]|uniref:ATP-dependent helicase HrpB n=1 Tax=Ornithinimicrobium pekingense TaxID=384677 RepID=A0ABQ2F3G5_9MICO|nr:ATP-dependent helicase HrpB [Ornithinimicrobium pekingense]GGK58253.1 ATP-dependent helicase HrpB [Ornithinimicrobium pekingense]
MSTFDLARIGTGLPFVAALPQLREALDGRGVAVVRAEPGAGKTTLVPPAVADLLEVRGADARRVVVTGPRRVVVQAAARRLAALTGTRVGGPVGSTVRGERQVGRDTVVEHVTAGVLVRRLLSDPELVGTGAVVLDEVHERGLDTDLLVGMLAEVRALRPDLVLVAMSATLDVPALAEVLGSDDGPAPVVDHPSAQHPLEVVWTPPPVPRLDARGVTDAFLDHVSRTTTEMHARALAADSGADALVFVPGVREVDRVVEQVSRLARGTEVLALHGRLDLRAQDRAVAGRGPGDPPRVVVATALAESSLTVPGVRLVVDAGLARVPRRDLRRDMSGLVTVQASRAAMTQRAGRAARLGPGTVVRCLDETTFAHAPEHAAPEISSSDLTGALLTLAAWGSPRGEGMPLLTAPPPAAVRAAEQVLHDLGLVDADGRTTELGVRAGRVPADPRLARALLAGAPLVGARAAAEVVATLADDHRAPDGDLAGLVSALRSGRAPGAARWRGEVVRLRRWAEDAVPRHDVPGHDVPGLVTALAHPSRVARRDGSTWLLASGTRAALPPGSPLQSFDWVAVADVTRTEGRAAAGTGAVIRLAAGLGADGIDLATGALRTREVRAAFVDGRVVAREVDAIGAIELAATPVRPSQEAGARAVADALARDGLGILTWSGTADALRRRMALLHRVLGDPWPDVSEAALAARAEEWLGPELRRLAAGTPVDRVDLADPLRRLLPWPRAARLDELAPERLPVPSGSRVAVTYPPHDDPDARPVVAVKLQECFGLADTPRLVDGRVATLFHLLSPAGRPLAVTDDLRSFWAGPYAQVRAEMRGRYPRHPWPEDPWSAPATARTNRRR